MNDEVQRRKIIRFLKGKGNQEIDAFCIYQWIDRCHYQGWWDFAVALGPSIPPNSLSQDYQKRIEFLLGQCRNQIYQRKDQFVEIGNTQDTHVFPIPKALTENILGLIPKSKRPYDIRTLRLTFWNGFTGFVLENQSTLRITKVYPEHWLDIHFGHPRCHICMTINTKRDIITCELYIPDAKYLFQKLLKSSDIIEQELGESLQWDELPGKKASRIKLIRDADVTNSQEWNEYFAWLKDKAENMKQIFSKYL